MAAQEVSHVSTDDKLSNRNLWTFSAGGIGRDMAYNLWNGFLLICIMYTKGVTAKQLSIILVMMAVCRIWDAVNDPIMGGLIERTRTKWGKFKPWILIGAISNAVITFTIFAVPLRGQDFLIFFPFAYLLWDITYTMNDIGYWAMLPSLTSNDTDRNKLSSLAVILAGIGAGIAGIIIPIFTTGKWAIGNSAVTGFTVMAALIGIVFIGCQAMTTFCVKEKPLPPVGEKIGIKAMFKVIAKNDQLLWIALVMILYNLGSSLYGLSLANFVYFRFGYEGVNATLFSTLGGILGGVSILYPVLAKRFSRKTISIVGIAMACVGYALFFIVGSATMSATNSKAIFAGLIVCSSLISMGQTMFYMVQTVSIANTIEYNEWKTGKRDEGIIFSVRPFMAKMGSALVVVVQMIIYGILKVGDYTNGISDLENNAKNIIANNTTSGADYDALLQSAGYTYDGAKQAILAENSKASTEFADVIGWLKNTGIQKILDGVDDSTKTWMLFGLTIIPAVFVIAGLIVWCKKFKIDEKFYADIVTENEARKKAAEETVDTAVVEEAADVAENEEVVNVAEGEEAVDNAENEEVVDVAEDGKEENN